MSPSRTEENPMHTWGTASGLVSSKETDPQTAQTNSVTASRTIRGLLQNSIQCQSKIPIQIQTQTSSQANSGVRHLKTRDRT